MLDGADRDEHLIVRIAEVQFVRPEVPGGQPLQKCRGREYVAVRLDPDVSLRKAALEEAPAEVVNLASRRKEARERGEFEEADRLRKEVEAAGWRVRDKPDGFDLVPL